MFGIQIWFLTNPKPVTVSGWTVKILSSCCTPPEAQASQKAFCTQQVGIGFSKGGVFFETLILPKKSVEDKKDQPKVY